MTAQKNTQYLIDRSAITDLIYQYCRSVDRLDIALGRSIWNSGAFADYGEFYQGDGPGVIDLICKQHQHLQMHSHQVTNILLELSGDSGTSESYVTATLRLEKDNQPMQMMVWSRYIDTWSKREGRWGLDKRIAIRDFDEIRPVTPMSQHFGGTRDQQDPSYTAIPTRSCP
ncbi:nuclear transport factor 2 family protein [Halioxenophilus sp. WMMB6]|uniref:nuclear transport factor 2 family protein n=1 Tax=Halioxenophilus sp. WMMB6 TaxID=3073815 RepID=UPI00295EA69D|nr:nuclear transport factor 2 family protein [Halioxenophilus sp. WMMB6]